MVLISSRKTCYEKMPAELNSISSDLAILYSVANFLSCHGPVPNHFQVRNEFADHQQIHGPAVAQGTTLRSIGWVPIEDGCFSNRKSVAQFKQFRLS